MKPRQLSEPFVEPERYELTEEPRYHFNVDRRRFFQVLGGGIAVLLFADAAPAQESGQGGRRRGGGQRPAELGAWLHIGEDGTITVFSGKAEVGQNIRTSLAQVVAEELRVPVQHFVEIQVNSHPRSGSNIKIQ